MRIKAWVIAGATMVGLSACGEQVADQALIGAGAGAATAVVLDGEAFTGAVIGAAGNLLYCQTNPGKCSGF